MSYLDGNQIRWFESWSHDIKDYILQLNAGSSILSDYLVHLERYKEIGNFIINNSKGDSLILDIGVSNGYTLNLLKFLERENSFGLDLSCNCIFNNLMNKVALFNLENIPPYNLPFKDKTFDIVIMTEVFEHLHPYQALDIMIDIKRILKNGGLLFFSTPNLAVIENRLSLMVGGVSKYRHGTIIPVCHTKEYTMYELLSIFSQVGLLATNSYFLSNRQFIIMDDNNSVIEVNFLKGLWRYPNLKNVARLFAGLLKKLNPSFRETIYIILEKSHPDKHDFGQDISHPFPGKEAVNVS